MAYPLSNLERQTLVIRENFNVLSKIVSRQSALVLGLFQSHGVSEEIRQAIEMNETVIDSLEVKIRNEVINGIVLYTPRAAESRHMFAYIDITGYLERVGDQLLNIMGHMQQIDFDCILADKLLPRIQEMLTNANKMVEDAIVAFSVSDAALSRNIILRDNALDDANRSISNDIPEILDDASKLSRVIHTALAINSIAYNIERIGDNATNIAEAAIYHAEGRDIKHLNTLSDATLTEEKNPEE